MDARWNHMVGTSTYDDENQQGFVMYTWYSTDDREYRECLRCPQAFPIEGEEDSYQAYSKAISWPTKLMTGDATDVLVRISPSSYRQQLIIVRTKADSYALWPVYSAELFRSSSASQVGGSNFQIFDKWVPFISRLQINDWTLGCTLG